MKMSFLEDFQGDLESLPGILQKKYGLLCDLDRSLQEIQRQNEQRCEQELEDIKQGMTSAYTSAIRYSDEALEEQKHAVRIADEKVALATRAYDLVDAHIQQLDQYLRKFDKELSHEKDNHDGTGPTQNMDGNVKAGRVSDSGRGRRKKKQPAVETATTGGNRVTMDLDLPVDPNEPTYCICNQVSYGEMVACDNPYCKIEWFHYGCVGLKEQPKGKWYCSDCVGNQKRRKGK